MLDNLTVPAQCGTYGCYAQVGWIHWGDCADLPPNSRPGTGGSCANSLQEHVFTEWSSDSGADQPVFYYNVPSGNENYYITRASSGGGSYHTFHFYWNEGSASSATTLTWGPAGIQNAEEVHDFGPNNEGSQYGGDAANPVNFSGLLWEGADSIDRTPSMTWETGGYWAISASNPIGGSMSVWDSRC